MAKTKTTQAGEVKTLDDFPGYTESKERLDRVRAKKAELEAAMLEAMDAGRRKEIEMSKVDRAAHAILTGEDLDQVAAHRRETFNGLEAELKATSRACEIAEAEYSRLWQLASAAVVASRQPEHRQLVAAIAEHLTDLVAAVRAEESWIRGLKDEGLHFVAGSGGCVNPQSTETAALFGLLRRVNVPAFRERLKRYGYL
ncbi:MAG: hypothetical protein GXX96_35285 [Planctomycetaceae bacterium]|nr:hypothetical protein [Planctomycetaceae bacterium]